METIEKLNKDSRYGAMYMFNKDANDKVIIINDAMKFVITTAHNLLITTFELSFDFLSLAPLKTL